MDNKLSKEEATPFIKDLLFKESGEEASQALIDMTFIDIAVEGFISKQSLYDYIVM